MSDQAPNLNELYAPSTPDLFTDDEEHPDVIDSSFGDISNDKSHLPDSVLESINDDPDVSESIAESNIEDLSLNSETSDKSETEKSDSFNQGSSPYLRHSTIGAKNNFERRPFEDPKENSDPDESFHIHGKRIGLEENFESKRDPNESYQVIKAAKRQGGQVIRSSGENSAEASDGEDKVISKFSASADCSFDSSRGPSPDESFHFALRKNKSKVRTIVSSDESDSDSSNVTNSITHTERNQKSFESDEAKEEVSPRKDNENDGTLEVPIQKTHYYQKQSHRSTPRSLEDALHESNIEKYDSGNGSSIEQASKDASIESLKSADNSDRAQEFQDNHDVVDDRSILELSSTIVSFSSPTTNEKEEDQSIEEVFSSPESPSVIAVINQPTGAELARLRQSLEQKQLLIKSCRLESLPDGGAKLKEQIRQLKEQLQSAGETSQFSRTAANMSSGSTSDCELEEEKLRKQLQMKKWAMGSAAGEQKDRLRGEISEMERRLLKISLSNATSAKSASTYKPLTTQASKPVAIKLLPEAPKLSDFRNEIHQRMLAEQSRGTKLLPEAPKLTEVQRQMYADHSGKELYKKSESGYISAAARREAVSVTLDALENLHRSLASCPGESEREPTPSCLAVPLLTHQERALKWLLWRETQVPAGGILADDMGLGKTLTMISLVVRQKELDPAPPASSDIWLSKTVKIKRSSGTLVVCPASVVGQWENEIKRRCKRNALSVVIFHGPDRHKLTAKLHQYDVVITTYQIVSREISNVSVDKKDGDSKPIGDFDVETQANEIRQSVLLQIAFDRIILDEAHVIRNPKSGVSQAVCRLRASRRWAVTGTPVQNKELDMYSLLRFLRVSPFDQLTVWKRWVDSSKAKNQQAADRLQLLIKTLLLRRTKDQKGEGTDTPLVAMPARNVHTHKVQLSREENEVYQKLLAFSRKALEEYIKSQESRIRDEFTFNRATLPELPQKNVTKQMMLVLLLRLRQVCSHPALIKTMLDTTDSESMGSEDAKIDDANDMDLISKMSTMTLGTESDNPKKEEENFFTHTNPVFDQENISSKMKYIIDEVKKVIDLGQKAVVVSQWTSMLEVFANHFHKMRIRCHTIAGNVPLKVRTTIVEDFNTNPNGKPVILLSLGAGGVGLNLIGGNHLFLADMHWNPQLEAQACDRVYRVGQKKDVHVHRMVTEGTVEERIFQLQQQKLAMANGILTGAAKLATKGLTIEDLKLLFNPGPPAYGSKSPNLKPY